MAEEIDVEKCNFWNFRRSVTMTFDQVKVIVTMTFDQVKVISACTIHIGLPACLTM